MSTMNGTLKGSVSSICNLKGIIANASLRGAAVMLQTTDTMLQWKYEDETDDDWRDLMDLLLVKDYDDLLNLPTVNSNNISGDITDYVMTPEDALTNNEISNITRRA